jgi:heterodisulfide reductase subunit A
VSDKRETLLSSARTDPEALVDTILALQEQVQALSKPKLGSALVVGGGIGGMQAALDLAASGIKVYLIDKKPAIGGVMSQLDKTFPTNDCAMCTMSPRLVEIGRHKDIEIITLSEVEKVEGVPGNFKVLIDKRARYVDVSKCTGCGTCVSKCPKSVPNRFNEGLSNRHAMHILYPQAVPNKPAIDKEHCLYFKTGKCKLCEKACEAKAINFDQKDEKIELDVGAIILAPGFQLFDAKVKEEYGLGRYPNVITSLAFERILSPSGPYAGKVVRPSDNNPPRRIAFLQCVGSRDFERDYCSSVCCMYATKEAIIAKEHAEGLECDIDIFFMDIRAFSKGFEEYYQRAKRLGVNYIRCRVPTIGDVPGTGNLIINYLTGDEKKASCEYDMVVLSAGMEPPADTKGIAEKFGIGLNEFNFCRTSPLTPVRTTRDGIYVAGPFSGPKDIPETVTQASGAASMVLSLLREARGTLVASKEYPPETHVLGQEPKVGVFVCNCGTNIGSVVNVPEVADYAKTLPHVAYVETGLYTCSNDSQENIKARIKEHGLNRLVVASCTPRTHEALFRNTIREAGLNPYLFELANIREQCAWVHMHEHEKATQKAKDLVRIAVAKARLDSPLYNRPLKVSNSALVIGGGISGMTSASELALQGFDVYLAEKESELGGSLRHAYYLLDGSGLQDHLKATIERLKDTYPFNKRVHTYTGATIEEIKGSVGNFKTKIATNGKTVEIEHGVVIVATGAKEYKPEEYLYGLDKRVITQSELEKRLALSGNTGIDEKPDTVVMIQCVGSRHDKRPYCSRTCCAEAIKNALKIKDLSPDTNVYVLYRDIRTYGFSESYYTKARQKGVVFMRYEEDSKPLVENFGSLFSVKVFEQTVKRELEIPAGLVVLSAATVAGEDNKTIAQFLKVPLTQDGFFLEAHMKLRPVDFATDGVFVCGPAHYPKSIDESIIQAQAVAARAATILNKEYIELDPTISELNEDKCDGCAYCVDTCPYKAITLVEWEWEGKSKKRVKIDEALCKGCGTCMATCPKDAVHVRHFELEKLRAEVFAALNIEG